MMNKKFMLVLAMAVMMSLVSAGFGYAEEAKEENPWAKLKKGDMVEFKSTTMVGATKMETGMRNTVKSNDGVHVVYVMEVLDKDGKVTFKREMKIKIKQDKPVKKVASKMKKTGTEKIKVPAGEYECEVWEAEGMKQWRCKDVPFGGVVKTEVKRGTMVSVIELVKHEKGK